MFGPARPEIDLNRFPTEDRSATSCGACKEHPISNAPAPRAKGFTMRVFLDSDHSGDSIIRFSSCAYCVP